MYIIPDLHNYKYVIVTYTICLSPVKRVNKIKFVREADQKMIFKIVVFKGSRW